MWYIMWQVEEKWFVLFLLFDNTDRFIGIKIYQRTIFRMLNNRCMIAENFNDGICLYIGGPVVVAIKHTIELVKSLCIGHAAVFISHMPLPYDICFVTSCFKH